MKIIWQFVVTKSLFKAIETGDLAKVIELTSSLRFDAFKINSTFQLSPIQAALLTRNQAIIHALLPSSMTLEQAIQLWLYTAHVNNPEPIYDFFLSIDLFCPVQNETTREGFLLQLLNEERWQALEWFFAKGFIVKFSPSLDFKPKQTVALSLFALKYGQEHLFKHLYPLLLNMPLYFSLNKNDERGKTIGWYLASQEKWKLLREVFRRNSRISLNTAPSVGIYKNTSVLSFCAQAERWNLFYNLLCLRTLSPLNNLILFEAPANNDFNVMEWILARAPTEIKKEIVFHIMVQLLLVDKTIFYKKTKDVKPCISQRTQQLFDALLQASNKNWIAVDFVKEFEEYKNIICSTIERGFLLTHQSLKEKIIDLFSSCGRRVPLSLRNREQNDFSVHLKETLNGMFDFFKQSSRKRKSDGDEENIQPTKKIKI